jgi:predicted translin family RNA/ssDNA-binding protein
MTSVMKMTKDDVQNIIRFFEILHRIHRQIQLNYPQSLPKEADEDLDQYESPKPHRSKTNSRIS